MKCWEILHTNKIDDSCELQKLFNNINYLNIEEFVEALCNEVKTHEVDNHIIIDPIKHFHQKSSSFSEVKKQINEIEKGSYIVLMAHQPNIFPSIAIIETIFVLSFACERATERTGKVFLPVYMFVDYDYADDKRFLNSFVPTITKPYKKTLKLQINSAQKKDAMFNIPKPDKNTLFTWTEIIEMAIKQLDSKRKLCSQGVCEKVLDLINECYEKATSFAEFNEFFLDNLINKIWNMGIVFFEGHELYDKNGIKLKEIFSQKEDINKLYNECLDILRKQELEVTMKEREISENYEWVYRKECNKRCRGKCSNNENDSAFSCTYDYLFPDVIYDNILDYILLHKIGTVGYYKQAEHILLSNYIYNKLWGEITPQLLVDPIGVSFVDIGVSQDRYTGKYVDTCENRHCSVVFFLASLGFEKTKKIIENIVFRRY